MMHADCILQINSGLRKEFKASTSAIFKYVLSQRIEPGAQDLDKEPQFPASKHPSYATIASRVRCWESNPSVRIACLIFEMISLKNVWNIICYHIFVAVSIPLKTLKAFCNTLACVTKSPASFVGLPNFLQ